MEALLIFESNKWHIIYMEITNHILLWKSGKKKKATSQIITKLALYEDNHSKADCCIFAYVSTMC